MAKSVKKDFKNNANRQIISRRKTPVKNYKPGLSLASEAPAKQARRRNAGSQSESLYNLFVSSLQQCYFMEKQLLKELPKIEKAAASQQLRNIFNTHLMMTREQVRRLEQVFAFVGIKAKAKKAEGFTGLMTEVGNKTAASKNKIFNDAQLVAATQKVEHYEIASYRGVVRLANMLDYKDAERHLSVTLEEETQMDQLLSDVAKDRIILEILNAQG